MCTQTQMPTKMETKWRENGDRRKTWRHHFETVAERKGIATWRIREFVVWGRVELCQLRMVQFVCTQKPISDKGLIILRDEYHIVTNTSDV